MTVYVRNVTKAHLGISSVLEIRSSRRANFSHNRCLRNKDKSYTLHIGTTCIAYMLHGDRYDLSVIQISTSTYQTSVTCSGFHTWFSWFGGKLMSGYGSQVGQNVRTIYNDLPSPMPVRRMAVRSYPTSRSNWTIPGYLYSYSLYWLDSLLIPISKPIGLTIARNFIILLAFCKHV